MSNKKKIIFIGSHLSKHRGTKGPSERVANILYDQFNIKLVSHLENQFLRMIHIILSSLFDSYDIMHIDVFSNKAFYYAKYASLIAKIRKKYVIISLHGGMLPEKYEKKPEEIKKVLSRADVLQSPSLFLIDFFQNKNIKVNYMPNFIDLTHFPFNRENVKRESILWVRAFSSEYQPELAVYIFSKILKNYPNATLTMIGPDRGFKTNIVNLVKELGIEEKVHFIGSVPNEKLFSFYQTHAVYLNTTAYESFGLAVLEAAACGIPIVSTKVGEIQYLWKEGEDILMSNVAGDDMDIKVLSIFDSSELAQKLSINARQKAETFDWKNIREKWIKVLVGEG